MKDSPALVVGEFQSNEVPANHDQEPNKEVRKAFEPRYGKKLTDREVWEIRFNLKNFALTLLEIYKQKHGGKNGKLCSKQERA